MPVIQINHFPLNERKTLIVNELIKASVHIFFESLTSIIRIVSKAIIF